YGGDITNKAHRANLVNNYYKPGPARPGSEDSYFVQSSYLSTQGTAKVAYWHLSGNVMEGSANQDITANNSLGVDVSAYPSSVQSSMISGTPFQVPYPVTTESAADAYNSVLAKAGAFPRDTVDRRIVNEVRTGTATGKGTTEKYLNSDGTTYSTNPYYHVTKGMIDNPLAVGGYPAYTTYNTVTDNDHDGMDDTWESAHGLDPNNAEDRNTMTESGYTALEVYLNSLCGESIPFVALDLAGTQGTGLYMAPDSENLIICCPEAVSTYSVFDVSGKRLGQSRGTDLTTVNVGQLSKGVYMLALQTTSGKKVNLKFIK
ncbi:MAG: T9SS type A sorting domain-containing protein, partial [Bacteroidota bacterium]|nr:T9SS type A sorting domain-containing protein [Bacteroidota bacterium]